jgi:hypothetical protein
MYNDPMSEDKVISKRSTQKLSDELPSDLQGENLDTVALLCMAVVRKEEYDQLNVDHVAPIEVHGADDTVVINPFLIVGSSDHTRSEAIERIHKVWDTFDKRLEEAGQNG